MRVALDTNIFINIFNGQTESDNCYKAIAKVIKNRNHCIVSSSAITDIYYILHKKLGDSEARIAINAMMSFSKIFDVNEQDIKSALNSNVKDFEDAVFIKAAKRNRAELILTYNSKDFENSEIKAITPVEYINS